MELENTPRIRRSLVIAVTCLLGAYTISLLTGCRSVQVNQSSGANAVSQELRLVIPQSAWEPFFFKEINQRTTEANLPNLRTILPNDDAEARVWFVTGNHGMDGLVLRRSSGQWSATYLYGYSQEPNFKKYDKQIGPPRSGWEVAWRQLVETGLLDLPDASQVECNVLGLDGTGYVVETNTNRIYRTYLYDNPPFAPCNEAKRLLKLIEIINYEFGLQWPTTK